jgi:hypothetical protein
MCLLFNTNMRTLHKYLYIVLYVVRRDHKSPLTASRAWSIRTQILSDSNGSPRAIYYFLIRSFILSHIPPFELAIVSESAKNLVLPLPSSLIKAEFNFFDFSQIRFRGTPTFSSCHGLS